MSEPATRMTMANSSLASSLQESNQRLSVGAAMRLGLFEHINPVTGGPTTITTTADDVTITFQYMLVTLRRTINGSIWWDDTLLSTPSWFLPGFAQGGLLAAGSGDAVQVLPYALLIARRATATGTWDNQQNTTHVGPLQVAVTDTGGGLSIKWDAMQAIGLLANVLPALPPLSDPQLGHHP
jgi:hypothetical protein